MYISSIDLIIIVSSIAALTIVHFFQGRRINLLVMRTVAQLLEHELRPVDKEYTLLSLYSGFHARYRLGDGKEVETYLILLPRYSILYLPIAKLLNKYDSLIIIQRTDKEIRKPIILKRENESKIVKTIVEKHIKHIHQEKQTKIEQLERLVDEDVKLLAAYDNKIVLVQKLEFTKLKQQIRKVLRIINTIELMT